MKVIKAIQEYEKPFVFSSTKKSTVTIFVHDCTVCSENRIDILNAKSIGKENLHVFITAIHQKDCFFLEISKEVESENIFQCWQTVTLKTDINLFLRLLSVCR